MEAQRGAQEDRHVSLRVRPLGPGEIVLLRESLESRRYQPFVRAYGLPNEAAVGWALRTFTEAAESDGTTLVVESGDSVIGGVAIVRSEFESSIYGMPMGRIAFGFISADDRSDLAREAAASLVEGTGSTLDQMAIRHCSAIVMTGDVALTHAFEGAGWRLMDSTLELGWECGRTAAPSTDGRVAIREPVPADDGPLEEFARDTYTQTIRTRFSTDPWLPLARTGDLYARWLQLSCTGEFADVVAVATIGGRPAGFCTMKADRALSAATGIGFATFGILAVAPNSRGLGVAPALLNWLSEWHRARGGRFSRGRVLVGNHAMQRACLKSGAFVAQAWHTFHCLRGE